jgi:hypothetical protein
MVFIVTFEAEGWPNRILTFEAEGWPNRILAYGSRILLMNLDALFNYICSRYVLRSLFHTSYAFPMVVIVTFEAEAWPNRILACSSRLLVMNLEALPLFDHVPMLQICSSIFVSYWACFSDGCCYDFRGRRLAEGWPSRSLDLWYQYTSTLYRFSTI